MTTHSNAMNAEAIRSAGSQRPRQESVGSLLLGGRSPEEVLADFRAKQEECKRMKEAGFVLGQDIQRLPCGAISGGMRPVWITKAQSERQNRWAAMTDRLNGKASG